MRPPLRSGRVLSGYTMMGRPIDCRPDPRAGAPLDCSFCSIIEMRGRNFHRFTIDRVIADINGSATARPVHLSRRRQHHNRMSHGSRRSAGPSSSTASTMWMYVVQAMTAAIATHGAATLAPLMRKAGFRYVFLGIENVLEDDLAFLKGDRQEQSPPEINTTLAAVRRPSSARSGHRRRTDRRKPRRHAGIDRDQSRLRAKVRGLALHSASDAISRNADDA